MSNYVYYNVNPTGETLPDCVTRAISLATGIDYYDVSYLLKKIGDIYSCDELCVCCYSYLLNNLFKFKRHKGNGNRIKDIIEEHNNDVLIIRIEGHLTCSMYGIVYDIWDCTDELVDIYWEVG